MAKAEVSMKMSPIDFELLMAVLEAQSISLQAEIKKHMEAKPVPHQLVRDLREQVGTIENLRMQLRQ